MRRVAIVLVYVLVLTSIASIIYVSVHDASAGTTVKEIPADYTIKEIESDRIYVVTTAIIYPTNMNVLRLTAGLQEIGQKHRILQTIPLHSEYNGAGTTSAIIVYVEKK